MVPERQRGDSGTGEDRDRLERVKEILEHSESLGEDERRAYLERVCADDSEIHREVASLLAFEEEDSAWPEGPLLATPGSGTTWSGPPRSPSLEPGQQIGPYRVVRLLGSGGMGEVAEAVREGAFEKKVALKVVHQRLPEDWIQRFEQERQVLAKLEHPNIARILDGDTAEDGRPWFAMELVVGAPIDVYCRERKLGLRQRLGLVSKVCSALSLAHQNLIVHRDLKPSNLLVDASGEPKLLDFGIAKRLEDDEEELTRLRERPMTLRYGSPEQVKGGLITTATDVYGVGLLLYELLTGRQPFDSRGITPGDYQLSKAILETPPPPPSQLVPRSEARQLRGDLDAIVAKALRKRPEHRYGSVAELAEDLERHLDGRPVKARQGSWLYSTRRFVRRHRIPVLAATAIFVLGLAFGTVSTLLWSRAETARAEAEQAREEAEEDRQLKDESLDFLKDLLREAGPNKNPGGFLDAKALVDNAEARLEGQDPLVQAELLGTIATVYRGWGELDRAGNAHQRAEDLLWRLYPEGHPALAKAINNVAASLEYRDRFEEAAERYAAALEMKDRFPEAEGVDRAKTLTNLANVLRKLGRYEGVEESLLEALRLRREAAEPDLESVARSLRSVGVFYHARGQLALAETFLREAVETYSKYEDGEVSPGVASALGSLGRALHDLGRLEEAGELYARALSARIDILGEDHWHVMLSYLDRARWALDSGNPAEAHRDLERVEAWISERSSVRYVRLRGRALSVRGALRLEEGRFAEAERDLEAALELQTQDRRELGAYGRRTWIRLQQLYGLWPEATPLDPEELGFEIPGAVSVTGVEQSVPEAGP